MFGPFLCSTYAFGESTGYIWENDGEIQFADENYARELLQLFSVGLYKLNGDGTIKSDSRGHEVRTYTNEDLSEYARVFVGMWRSSKRGNIEDRSPDDAVPSNLIDPMFITTGMKDYYPKVSKESDTCNTRFKQGDKHF